MKDIGGARIDQIREFIRKHLDAVPARVGAGAAIVSHREGEDRMKRAAAESSHQNVKRKRRVGPEE